MNWKTFAGALIIFGAISEMTSIISDYRSGKLKFWPFGADIACIALIVLGMYLMSKGLQKKKQL